MGIRGLDNCYFVDTPGVGDHDAKLSDVIPMIEEYFKAGPLGNGVHGVVITCAVGQGRLTLGSKIAGEVLKLSVFKYDGDARDRVIICGTKRDKEDPEDQEEWRDQVAPFFAPVIGGEPGHICLTGCKFTAKGRGKNNIVELEKALQQVRTVDEAMAFTKADSTELLTVLKDSAGLDINASELRNMAAMMDSMRQQIEEQNQRFAQLMDDFRTKQLQTNALEEKLRRAAGDDEEKKQKIEELQKKITQFAKDFEEAKKGEWKEGGFWLLVDAIPFVGTVANLRRLLFD